MSRYTTSTPLARSTLKVVITDLLAAYELRHTFRNEGEKAIEAVYSFPVPLDAAFGGMDATLGGETLAAQVLPATQANRRYDNAIADGDSAVLLEQVELGMLCVNLGNLKPGEEGEIVLRFYAALNVADGVARFSLPLVHRPRYGRTKLDEIVNPAHDFAAEHPLEAEIRVCGLLAGRAVECATQGASFAQESGETILRIGRAMLDRDLVLNFALGDEQLSIGRLANDGQEAIGLVTVTVPKTISPQFKANDICLLLDCSGSMSGDAITQSRKALSAMADALQDGDRIQVLRFGSTTTKLFRRPLKALPWVKDSLRELVPTIESDMGGTDIDSALNVAMDQLSALDGDVSRKVLILVTDGAVTRREIEDAQERACALGIRIFVVAVGSSAGVDVLAPLAERTSGFLERAVPAEPIDDGVMRQFRRARTSPCKVVVDWGRDDANVLPLDVVYPGDALTAVAIFTDKKPGMVSVRMGSIDRHVDVALSEAQDSQALRAWAGQQAYEHAEELDKERISLRYGLITEETKAVLVKVRANGDKATELPIVVPVKHMLPDGMAVSAMVRAPSGGAYLMRGKATVDCVVRRKVVLQDSVSRSVEKVRSGPVKVVPYKLDGNGRPIVPNGYKPSESEEYMNPLMLEYFRQKLLERRAELVEEMKQTIESLREERGVGDDAEHISHETENPLERRTLERYRKLISKIDSVLKRIDSGGYGYCIDTGEEIGLERLGMRPQAERTIDAQERWEHMQKIGSL